MPLFLFAASCYFFDPPFGTFKVQFVYQLGQALGRIQDSVKGGSRGGSEIA